MLLCYACGPTKSFFGWMCVCVVAYLVWPHALTLGQRVHGDKRLFMYRPIGLRFVWPFVFIHACATSDNIWTIERNVLATVILLPVHRWDTDAYMKIKTKNNHNLATTIGMQQCGSEVVWHRNIHRTRCVTLAHGKQHTQLWLLGSSLIYLLNASSF